MRFKALNIINTVLEHYNLYYKDLVSKSRKRTLVEARAMSMYFIDKFGDETLEEIATRFNRDYDTVEYHIKELKAKLASEDNQKLKQNSLAIYNDLFDYD